MKRHTLNRRGSCALLAASSLAWTGASATAQQNRPWQQPPPLPGVAVQPAHPLDQGVADLDLLKTSMRQMPLDLRQDIGFEHVWASPTDPTKLMRRSGGISAVFPASAYLQTEEATLVLIPADTVFHIGEHAPDMFLPVVPAFPTTIVNAGLEGPSSDTFAPPANRITLVPAGEPLDQASRAEKITPTVAAFPERRIALADISNNDFRKATETAAGGSTEGELRVDEHTMSNEAYRRLTLHNLIIRHAD